MRRHCVGIQQVPQVDQLHVVRRHARAKPFEVVCKYGFGRGAPAVPVPEQDQQEGTPGRSKQRSISSRQIETARWSRDASVVTPHRGSMAWNWAPCEAQNRRSPGKTRSCNAARSSSRSANAELMNSRNTGTDPGMCPPQPQALSSYREAKPEDSWYIEGQFGQTLTGRRPGAPRGR